jgi:TonB family protein
MFGNFKLHITFTVEVNGTISHIQLENTSGFKPFDEMVVKAIGSIENKWIPAKTGGIPFASKFKMPLSFSKREIYY